MKKLLILAVGLIALSFAISGCNKEKSFKKDLVGTWNANYISETLYAADNTVADSYNTLDFITYQYTFKEDGTGTFLNVDQSGQAEVAITWIYNHEAQTLSITTNIFFEDTKVYDITSYNQDASISLELDHTYYVPEFGLDGERTVGSYNLVKE